MILCTSSAHTCAHGQYSIGDRRHDIRCATVGPYVRQRWRRRHNHTILGCARIVSLGRITRARYELYIIFLYYSCRYVYNMEYRILEMPKKYSFSHNTTQRGKKNHKDHHELHIPIYLPIY